MQDFINVRGWNATVEELAQVGFYKSVYQGAIWQHRRDIIAVGKKKIKSGKMISGAYDKEGNLLYDSVANTELVDNRLPLKTSKTVSAATAAFPWNYLSGGCYILSLTGSNDTTGIYKVSEGELAALIDDANDISDNIFDYSGHPQRPSTPNYGSDFLENVYLGVNYMVDDFNWFVDYIKYAVSQFFGSGNVPENIRECRYLPFDVGISGSPQPIYLGTFQTKQTLGKLTNDTVVQTVTVNIPWQVTDFRRRSPYTDVYIYLPYIGLTKLSSENLTSVLVG